ncbi:MAG: hypothetical protein ACOC22_03990 [bacterium]
MLKPCVCGKIHCPYCYNQIEEIPGYCPVCNNYIEGDEWDDEVEVEERDLM